MRCLMAFLLCIVVGCGKDTGVEPSSPPPAPHRSTDSLDVVEARMVEYPTGASWAYAPIIQVKSRGGSVDGLRLEFGTPGGAWPYPPNCSSTRILPGQTAELNVVSYGDYQLSLGEPPGGRVPPKSVFPVKLLYRLADGYLVTGALMLPVVPGDPPPSTLSRRHEVEWDQRCGT